MRISDWSSDVCSSDLIIQQLKVLMRLCSSRSYQHPFQSLSIQGSPRIDGLMQAESKILLPLAFIALTAPRKFHPNPLHHRLAFAAWSKESNLCFCQNRMTNYLRQQLASRKVRSEEHTSELQSLMRTSYAVFCLTTKNNHHHNRHNTINH